MQRLFFTLFTILLSSGILRAQEDVPVVDVSTEAEAVVDEPADTAEAAAESVETVARDAEAEIEKAVNAGERASESPEQVEENVGNAESADVNEYKRQGDWDLNAKADDKVVIRKIYEFLNDPKVTKFGKEKSIEYEFKYFNHGAITKAQRHNREGQYYVVTWTNKGQPADYELRIDYRQSKTRDKINTITIPYPKARGTFKGTFSITGDHYYMYGSILSWRISVVRDGVIVAQNQSFVW